MNATVPGHSPSLSSLKGPPLLYLCCRGGSGGRECTRHHPPGPKLLAPHPVKEAPCGEVAVHERVPLLVEETDAGMYGPAGSEKTFVLKVMGALPLGHVFVEASTTRGHDEFAALGATLPQLRARKVVFIPDLIPQPDWDKYHFFSG